jgi:uncharacterized protein (TIGR03083 family)
VEAEKAMAPDPLKALRGECELVSQLTLGLPEEDFSKATRLPAWNVKELLGHLYRAVDRTNTALDEDEPPAADSDSITYWRIYDPATDSPATADRAKEVAAQYGSGQQLAAALDTMWRKALGRAADTAPGRVVHTWGPSLMLEEFMKTRVLEVTVHRMDLNDALGLPPDPTDDGLTITADILLGLMEAEPPAPPPWNRVEFLEKGTGRTPLSEADRQRLGSQADRFPLLA